MEDWTLIDEPDIQRELNWLIEVRTCEWCGTCGDDVLQREWLCRRTKHTKHWKAWRVCGCCKAAAYGFTFNKWMFPVITAPYMPLVTSADLYAVQPMQEPQGQIMYMDLVCTPPRAPDRTEINAAITEAVGHLWEHAGPIDPAYTSAHTIENATCDWINQRD